MSKRLVRIALRRERREPGRRGSLTEADLGLVWARSETFAHQGQGRLVWARSETFAHQGQGRSVRARSETFAHQS